MLAFGLDKCDVESHRPNPAIVKSRNAYTKRLGKARTAAIVAVFIVLRSTPESRIPIAMMNPIMVEITGAAIVGLFTASRMKMKMDSRTVPPQRMRVKSHLR